MRHSNRMLCRATGAALLGLCSLAPALAGGPPWISVEAPVDPQNHAARGAALLVHVYGCGAPMDTPVEAVAEGLVNGERRSVAIKLRPTGQRGVYAIDQQWPAEGTWALALTLKDHAPTTTLIQLGPNGGVEADRYYNQDSKAVKLPAVRVFARRLSPNEIDAALRSAPNGVAVLEGEPDRGATEGLFAVVAIGAPLLVGGVFAAGRRRRRAVTT
jgi:hypothetical protein